jgi:NADPH:quinone reductase-like Zn-dependent oxidoreductase
MSICKRSATLSWKQAWIRIFVTKALTLLLIATLTEVGAFAPTLLAPQRSTSLLSLSSESYSWIVPQGVSFGSLDTLKFEPTETDPTNNESSSPLCKVSTRSIGLNFADIFCILGLYSAANEVRGDSAFCPGLEYAGVVMEDPTNTFSPGQRVLGFSRFGAYADVVQVPPYFLHPLPSNWTYTQGAAFLVQAITAWHGLVEIGGMPVVHHPAETTYVVLIHSASGGVGLWASEMAARRGAIVIGVIGSEAKAPTFEDRILPLSPKSRTMVRGDERTFGRRLAELLCEIHGTTKSDLPPKSELEYLRKNGNGVDVVMESLGGQYFTESFQAMNRGGSLVTFGSTSYVSPGLSLNKVRLVWRYLTRPRVDPGTLTSRNIRLAGFNLIFLTDMPDELRRELRECILCLSGSSGNSLGDREEFLPLDSVTPPVVGDVFDFRTEGIVALERLKSGETVGKVVLDNSNNPVIL